MRTGGETEAEWTVDDAGALTETRFRDLRLVSRGKVRDVYDLGPRLLFVATDRISAFDWVLPTGIPDGGSTRVSFNAHWLTMSRVRFQPRPVT